MYMFVLGSPEKTQGKGNSKSTDLLWEASATVNGLLRLNA